MSSTLYVVMLDADDDIPRDFSAFFPFPTNIHRLTEIGSNGGFFFPLIPCTIRSTMLNAWVDMAHRNIYVVIESDGNR